VLGDAWDANLEEIRQTGEVDLLCFTGDLAFSGKPHEYGSMARPELFTVSELLSRTIAALGLSRDRVYLVPGNHDIDREINAIDWAELRKLSGAGTRDDADLVSRWLCGGDPPRGYRPELRHSVLARRATYHRWVEQHFGERLLPRIDAQTGQPPQGHPNLGYRNSLTIGGHGVHVLGLDSAWLAGDGGDARKLWLTHDQVLRASTNREGRALAGFRIALVHHPLAELVDGERSEELLAERIDLLLHGHLHEAAVRTVHDPQRTFRIAAAGSLYERDTYRNGMQVIDVALDHDGWPRRYDVWFRSWSSRARAWRDDESIYARSQQGRVSWQVEPPAARPEPSRPPRLPVRVVYEYPGPVVKVLHGRAEQLAQLVSSLRDPAVRVTVISGRAGSGKTALVRKGLAELIQARDLHGIVTMSDAPGEPFSVAAVLAGLDQLDAPPRRLGDAVLADNTRTFRSRVEEILDRLEGREVILLLDGFESLIKAPGELDPDAAELLELARSHQLHRLHIVIATRQLAIEVFDDPKLVSRVVLTDHQGNDLDEAAAEALLRSFEPGQRLGLASTTAEVFAKVHRLTRGNPRELERLVRRLMESPGLTLAGWVDETTAPTGELDKVQAEIMFEGTSPIERAVLLAFAVSGDPASGAQVAAMLTRLLGVAHLALGEVFHTLCGRYQLLRCTGGYTLHPRDREVLLAACQRAPIEVMDRSLTTADLQRADCEILEASVATPAELSSAAQAEALVRAITGRLTIGDLDRARRTLLATEDQLLLFGAVEFVADTAARLLARPVRPESERCWLCIRAGDAKDLLGDAQAALAYYDQARQIATDEQRASIDVMRARFLIGLGRLDEADQALRRCRDDSRVTTDPTLACMYWHEGAGLARNRLRLDDALDCERRALRACGDDRTAHGQRANLARALMDVGVFVEAERHIRDSLAVSSQTMNRVFHANQLATLSDALLGRGQLAAAEQCSLRSLAARREIGVAGYIARSVLSHGWLMEIQARGDEAAAAYREALELQRALPGWTAAFPAAEISVALAAGHVAAAAAALSEREVTSPTTDRDRLLLGGLRLAQGDMAGAVEAFRQVVGQARTALAVCARNTRAGRRLVVALCGLVAAGEDHDVVTQIDQFRSNIDSLGPVMELRHQLRVLHRYDRTGRTTPALERCDELTSRAAVAPR
jgi:tetratricopeptide (TPR) repeat protein/predicted phosphodiesterase